MGPKNVALSDVAGSPVDLDGRDCLMYLSRSEGIAVFYDVGTRESVRVPASAVVLSLRYRFFVDPTCRTVSD